MIRLTSALVFIGHSLRYLSFVIGIAALYACGQTGPLYLPEDTADQESAEQDQDPSKPDQSSNRD